MQAGNEEVYADESEEDPHEADHEDPGGSFYRPTRNCTGVQVDRIDKEKNQGKTFFWVPTPVASPGFVSPHRSGDYRNGKGRETQPDHHVGEVLGRFQRGEPVVKSVGTPGF